MIIPGLPRMPFQSAFIDANAEVNQTVYRRPFAPESVFLQLSAAAAMAISEFIPILSGIVQIALTLYQKRCRERGKDAFVIADRGGGDDAPGASGAPGREADRTPQARAVGDFLLPARDPWVSPGEVAEIGIVSVAGGLFYCGRDLPNAAADGNDPCLIDPDLPLCEDKPEENSKKETICEDSAFDAEEFCGAPFHTDRNSPSYATLRPGERLAFLKWLNSDRADASLSDAGLMIYFWGLERRCLVDGFVRHLPAQNSNACAGEVRRLRGVFKSNSEFIGYAKRFACMFWIASHNIQLCAASPNFVDDDFCAPECSDLLAWRIAQFAVQFRPVAPKILCAWYDAHPDFGLPCEAKSDFGMFYRVFEPIFYQKYPQGLRIRPSHESLTILYRSSNPSLGTLSFPISGGFDAFDQIDALCGIRPVIETACRSLDCAKCNA